MNRVDRCIQLQHTLYAETIIIRDNFDVVDYFITLSNVIIAIRAGIGTVYQNQQFGDIILINRDDVVIIDHHTLNQP